MIRRNTSHKTLYRPLLATTAMILFACAQGAAARGGNSGDHGGMRSRNSNAHEAMIRHQSHRHRDRGDGHGAGNNTIRPIVTSQRHRNNDKHGDKSHDHTAKSPVKCIKAPCSREGGDRDAKHGHKQAGDENKGSAAGTSIGSKPPAVPGTAGNNTIHPIVTNKPGQSTADAGSGKLPPNDPVGNTHPTPGLNPPTVVSVSNGVTTTQIQNGPGGVAVYSDKPGTITVTNGKESTTLNGASVTLSGNVVGVGHSQGVEVGPRNAEGKTVVAIKPPPETPPAGTLQRNDPRDVLKCFGCDVLGGVADFGYGITHGFAPGPVPPPKTSTTTQR
jgi:hypothetical protein